ncbi:MAG: class II aldolase/adducin family protein [Armatimonadota bacterium]
MTVSTSTELRQLVEMSRELGLPERDLAILGEGNTSALVDGDKFWVKASGSMLGTIDEGGFVLMDRDATAELLNAEMHTDAEILAALMKVRVEEGEKRPSIEAMMHAYLLGLPGVTFVGHTHPASVNAIACSVHAEKLSRACLFPDQIVCCGPSPVFVPYSDPGLPLARLVRDRVHVWMETHQMAPRAIFMQNHGLFALGNSPQQVLSCTLMWEKTARVIIGAMACGGVNTLTPDQVNRIFTRPDEKYREKQIGGGK